MLPKYPSFHWLFLNLTNNLILTLTLLLKVSVSHYLLSVQFTSYGPTSRRLTGWDDVHQTSLFARLVHHFTLKPASGLRSQANHLFVSQVLGYIEAVRLRVRWISTRQRITNQYQ